MRKIFVMGAALLAASATYAFNDKHDKFCQSVASLSKSIMEARQNGADVTKAMNVFKDEEKPATRKMMQELVISAYEKPRYSISSNKVQAALDFKNETYIACIRAM